MDKYGNLLKKTKQARIGQLVLSGMSPVFGSRSRGYSNLRRVTVNEIVQQLCTDEEVGFVDLQDSVHERWPVS